MAQKVIFLENYYTDLPDRNFHAGHVYELEPWLIAWLLRDSPGCLELVPDVEPEPEPKPRRKSVKKPPQDKAVLEPVEEK